MLGFETYVTKAWEEVQRLAQGISGSLKPVLDSHTLSIHLGRYIATMNDAVSFDKDCLRVGVLKAEAKWDERH